MCDLDICIFVCCDFVDDIFSWLFFGFIDGFIAYVFCGISGLRGIVSFLLMSFVIWIFVFRFVVMLGGWSWFALFSFGFCRFS